MPKLTDTELVILSAAAKRKDGAVLPPPKSLKAKGGVLTRCLKGLLKRGLVDEQPAKGTNPPWRETEDGNRMSLVVTNAGLQAIGVEPTLGTKKQAAATKAQSKTRRQAISRKASKPKPKTTTSPPVVRPGTKQALLIDLLRRRKGATIAEIGEATGWQPHSVRGAISGTLKKKLGLTVTSEEVDRRGRVYRIAQSH